mgnify:CR=1 FL=1
MCPPSVGSSHPPRRQERSSLLRSELDTAYCHIYGIERDDVDYIIVGAQGLAPPPQEHST